MLLFFNYRCFLSLCPFLWLLGTVRRCSSTRHILSVVLVPNIENFFVLLPAMMSLHFKRHMDMMVTLLGLLLSFLGILLLGLSMIVQELVGVCC